MRKQHKNWKSDVFINTTALRFWFTELSAALGTANIHKKLFTVLAYFLNNLTVLPIAQAPQGKRNKKTKEIFLKKKKTTGLPVSCITLIFCAYNVHGFTYISKPSPKCSSQATSHLLALRTPPNLCFPLHVSPHGTPDLFWAKRTSQRSGTQH